VNTLEEPNVNRPFYAFGALAGALALTMLAVSSTSRSTTVRRPVPSSQASAQAKDPKSARLGNIYVVVLPAGDDLAEDPTPMAARIGLRRTKRGFSPRTPLDADSIA
jgi:hypothetical protein